MEHAQFESMVARLEHESATAPGLYQAKVAALAVAGFVILGAVIGFAASGLLLIAVLVLATLFTGGGAVILLLKLGKLLVLLAIPLWMLVKSSLQALFTRLPAPQGLELQRAQAPTLFGTLDGMRRCMHGPRFHHVLVTDEVNAAVVQRPLFGLFGFPRNYLIIGLPLLEAFTPDEALAVVAHEYGHLAGSHSRFGAFIYRLRLTWATIHGVTQQWQGWASWPLQKLVAWYAPYFNAYTFVLARANEFQADGASAELVGAAVAASALKRVNIVAPQYQSFDAETVGAIRDAAEPPRDRALRWAGLAHRAIDAEQGRLWLGDALRREPQSTDTHPALHQRLAALPGQAEHLDELPAPLTSESAASAWFGDGLAALRETLQHEWHERLAGPWKARHLALQAQLQRLADLDAVPAPNVAEQIERLRLAVDLHPERDHFDALAAFNAEHPDQPLPIYLEAGARLARDDESGLALLEHVIVLDPDAIKPVCERAHGWLAARHDERAKVWAERWNQRNDFETMRARELANLDPTHELRTAELNDAVQARVLELLHQGGKSVKRAWLARRMLPSDPTTATYVLSIELTAWATFRSQGQGIVSALAKLEWPIHLFVCELDKGNPVLREKLEALPSTQLPLAR